MSIEVQENGYDIDLKIRLRRAQQKKYTTYLGIDG